MYIAFFKCSNNNNNNVNVIQLCYWKNVLKLMYLIKIYIIDRYELWDNKHQRMLPPSYSVLNKNLQSRFVDKYWKN